MRALMTMCADLRSDTIRIKDGNYVRCEMLNIFDDRVECKIGDEVRTAPESSVDQVIMDRYTKGDTEKQSGSGNKRNG